MSGLSGVMGGLGKFGLAAQGIQFAGSAIGTVIDKLSKPISLAAEFEGTSTALATLVGDMKVADGLLAQVKKYGDDTSFDFPELAASARSLVAFGANAGDALTDLKRLGDVAAGVQKPIQELAVNYGKARVQGTLFAEDINLFTEAGIPVISEMARVVGVSQDKIKKLGSEGKLTFPILQEAFRRMTAEGGKFYGMTDKMGQTTLGMWSTLKGGVEELYRKLGEPINDALRPLMKDINTNWLPKLSSGMSTAISTIRIAVAKGNLGDLLRDALVLGLARVGNFAEGLFNYLPALLGVGLEGVANTFNGTFSKNGLDALTKFGSGLLKAIQAAGTFIWSAIGDPIRDIAAGFQASLELAGNIFLDAIGQLDPSLRKTFAELKADALAEMSPGNLTSRAKDELKSATQDLTDGLVSLYKAGKDVVQNAKTPEFKQGTSFNQPARIAANNLANAIKQGQAAEDKKAKESKDNTKALEENTTSQEQQSAELKKAISAANVEKAAKTKEYKPWREQRADALADRRAQVAARASQGYSRDRQHTARGSSLDYLKGKGLSNVGTGSSLDYLKGKGLSDRSDAGVRGVGRRGEAAAGAIQKEGAERKVVARVNRRQDAQGNDNPAVAALQQLLTAVQTMQKSFDQKLGVA